MKKNPNGGGSISKKIETKNGKTYESWRCRYSLPDGTRHEKKFSTQAEAQAYLTRVLADIQNGDYLEPSKMTVSQWLDSWLDDYCGHLKYNCLKSYKSHIETHLKPGIGKIKLTDLNAAQIQKFINKLGKTGKKTTRKDKTTGKQIESYAPLAPKSIYNIHGTLSSALATAVDIDLIKSNPAEKVNLPHVYKKEMHPLDSSQLSSYLAACTNDQYRYFLQIMPLIGLRVAEQAGLTWDNIDFEKGTITIKKQLLERSLADGGPCMDTPKNHKSRILKPAPFAMTLFAARKVEQEQEKEKAGDLWQGYQSDEERKTAPVFTSKLGGYVNQDTLLKHAKKVLSSIGMDSSVMHDLRHSFAVLGIQAGDDFKTISENLGHSTVAFTMDRYGHLTDKMRDESSKKMQALLDAL